MRILLIEDDFMIGEAIKQILVNHNFIVNWLEDGESGLIAIENNIFDLVILDLNLPDIDGHKIIEIIRKKKNHTPVIILSARNAIEDKITLLNSGADDYLTKPFDSKELIARIKSITRRATKTTNQILKIDRLSINLDEKIALYDDKIIQFTPKEFLILKKLIENKNKPISRQKLENILYNWDEEVESNAVEVHIHNIRKKTSQSLIKNIRGFGYKI